MISLTFGKNTPGGGDFVYLDFFIVAISPSLSSFSNEVVDVFDKLTWNV